MKKGSEYEIFKNRKRVKGAGEKRFNKMADKWTEDIWHKKYTQEEKKLLSKLGSYGMDYKQIEEMSEKVMKKVYAHGDTSDSTREFVKIHPEYRNSLWVEQKKMLKKRFPYLTSEEINYIGKISGDFKKY